MLLNCFGNLDAPRSRVAVVGQLAELFHTRVRRPGHIPALS
jgi:hypothetical protein